MMYTTSIINVFFHFDFATENQTMPFLQIQQHLYVYLGAVKVLVGFASDFLLVTAALDTFLIVTRSPLFGRRESRMRGIFCALPLLLAFLVHGSVSHYIYLPKSANYSRALWDCRDQQTKPCLLAVCRPIRSSLYGTLKKCFGLLGTSLDGSFREV